MVIELVAAERASLVRRRRESAASRWFDVLDRVVDPEVPVLSIWELGVLQDVREEAGAVYVTLTPTYSGCPAMERIANDTRAALEAAGAKAVRIDIQLLPAWSTDWMDAAARKRLRAYGIAPPDDLRCPQCAGDDVEVVSDFGSTACKALYRCRSCLEPFDYFKQF